MQSIYNAIGAFVGWYWGIPILIILFGGGLLLAAGSLVAMRFVRNRRPSERSPYDPDDEDDDEDDYEY